MLDKHVIREGTLLMKGGEVFLDGWEINEGGMCREVAILACHYAARRLLEFASRLTMEAGSAHVVMDLPPETPREWLCPETKRFIDMFDSSTTQETIVHPFFVDEGELAKGPLPSADLLTPPDCDCTGKTGCVGHQEGRTCLLSCLGLNR